MTSAAHAGESRADAGPRRQLILCMSVSLDGFVARTDGVIDWLSSQSPVGVDHADISSTAYADGCVTQVFRPA